MGAESSLFKKCWIESEVQHKCKDWTLFQTKCDSKKFSIFVFNDNNFPFDISHWKTIRHPFIVKYYDCGLFRGKKCVVTEWVEPIKPLLSQLSAEQVVSGVHNIANSLAFIHSKCRLSVNNLSLNSLFMSRSESTDCWKLGSLLCLSSSNSENSDFSKMLLNYHNFLGTTDTLPVEDLLSDSLQLIESEDQIHRRDAFAFGLLVHQLLPDLQFSQSIECLGNESIEKRPNFKTVLKDELFVNSDFVEIKAFLMNFVSFNESEKKIFFSHLIEKLTKLSSNLIISLVTLIFNSRLIMSNTEVQNQFLPFVLIPANDSNEEMLCELTSGETITLKPLLNKKIFKTRIIPLICKLYSVRDLRIRLILLQYLPNYAPFVSKQCLRQLVLPQILIAMKDSDDQLVALTFKAISHLVNIFGANVVLGPRLKLFSNGIPKLNDLSGESKIRSAVNTNQSLIINKNGNKEENELKSGEQNKWDDWDVNSSHSKDNTNNSFNNSETNDNNYETNKRLEVKTIPKKSHNFQKDFDIKEIDFKLEDNEIDVLFSDMEPIFKFCKNDLMPEELDGFKFGVNTSNIFAANEDNTEEIGWTDHSWDNEWDKEDN